METQKCHTIPQQKPFGMSSGFCGSVEAFLSIQVVTELDPRTTIMSVEVVDALSYTVKIDERPRRGNNFTGHLDD